MISSVNATTHSSEVFSARSRMRDEPLSWCRGRESCWNKLKITGWRCRVTSWHQPTDSCRWDGVKVSWRVLALPSVVFLWWWSDLNGIVFPRLWLSRCSNLIKDFNFPFLQRWSIDSNGLSGRAEAALRFYFYPSTGEVTAVISVLSSPVFSISSSPLWSSDSPSSSSSFPQFFLLSSRSSLCSRCLLRPSGALFRLIGSIHQRSLESRGFSRIQTHVQPLELDRLTSNNFISLLSRPGDSERRRWWTFNSLIYQNVTTSQPWSKLDCCRPLLSWRNSAASPAGVCASLSD